MEETVQRPVDGTEPRADICMEAAQVIREEARSLLALAERIDRDPCFVRVCDHNLPLPGPRNHKRHALMCVPILGVRLKWR